MTWLDRFQKVWYPHTPGLRYSEDIRAVLFHSTEGSTFEGADSVFRRSMSAPHFTVDPWRELRVQHIDTDLASYALQNLAGGVETNTAGVIQIEVVGYTDDAKAAEHGRPGFALSQLSEWQYRWLGEQVLALILAAHPQIPHQVYVGPRMTGPEWTAWPGGICSHKDAPENHHWDTATLDLEQVLAHARPLLTPQGDFDMALSDDDIERIWNAVLPLADGQSYPARNVLGFIHGELTRPDLLERRLVDALVVALPVGPTGVSSEQIRTACANAVRDVLGSLG